MEFVRPHRPHGHRAARGPCALRGTVAQVQQAERVMRGLPRPQPARGSRMLEITASSRATARARSCWDVALDVAGAHLVCLMGRNGVGKTTLLKASWVCCRPAGSIQFDGEDLTRPAPTSGARAASATCHRGARSSRTSRWENLRVGLGRRGAASGRRAHLRPSSPCCAMLERRRRCPVRRPAAAARHRPRARSRDPKLLHPGRADRGHPAVDHQGESSVVIRGG